MPRNPDPRTRRPTVRTAPLRPRNVLVDVAPDRLVERLTTAFELTPEQEGRLAVYVHNPDRGRSRLNVGVRGRGRRKVPDGVRQFLHDYASAFRQEISSDELAYLLD